MAVSVGFGQGKFLDGRQQITIKPARLKKIYEGELPNHQANNRQKQPTATMFDPNHPTQTVESKEFDSQKIICGNQKFAWSVNM